MILLDRITKIYPGDEEPALDNVSLHIEPHEFVFLVGKSGAGKSTLIKMITKEEQPDSGKIIIGGIDLDYVKKRHIPHYRRKLGVVFQDYKLLPTRTVFENVAFALEIAGMSSREINRTVPKVLDLVGLEGKSARFPSNLSGGERQRVAIARSVARQPKILIADEPTGNLDVLTRHEIIDLLKRINDFGTTLLVTTHDENIVNDLGKRVITLKAGKIVDDQKYNGVYRLDSEENSPILVPRPKIITSMQASVRPVAAPRTRGSRMSKATAEESLKILHPTTKKTTAVKATTKPTATPKTIKTTSAKKLDRDAANQWYTASRPLKAAPKLSDFGTLGQTVKLKPAPSISQTSKRKTTSAATKTTSAATKTKTKRVI